MKTLLARSSCPAHPSISLIFAQEPLTKRGHSRDSAGQYFLVLITVLLVLTVKMPLAGCCGHKNIFLLLCRRWRRVGVRREEKRRKGVCVKPLYVVVNEDGGKRGHTVKNANASLSFLLSPAPLTPLAEPTQPPLVPWICCFEHGPPVHHNSFLQVATYETVL